MAPRLKVLYQKLGRVEKLFLLLLLLHLVLRFAAPASAFDVLIGIATYAGGVILVARLAKGSVGRIIWRLRNRLIVAYLFIAVVPIVLIVTLAGSAIYMLTGQVAVYLVSSELTRRTQSLQTIAEVLAHTPEANLPEAIRRGSTFLASRFPRARFLIHRANDFHYPEGSSYPEDPRIEPPAGWKDAAGVVLKDRRPYAWAHVINDEAEVTILAPLTHDFLAGMIPGLGDVFLIRDPSSSYRQGPVLLSEGQKTTRVDRIPPPYIGADIEVPGFNAVPVSLWTSPGSSENLVLVVRTRTSALMNVVFFGPRMDFGQRFLLAFVGVLILFVIVELISLIIGFSLSRTMTAAVHHLYEGTQRVKEGDFSHRIPVEGSDQLAELGVSFNTMTANLERLIVVAKEKERLQSELEIAREVQNQLFPTHAPRLLSLQLTGVCNPARMVSGDYYDFQDLAEHNLAFAIGDVAGKGISAALLMAAIQSAMRAQLTSALSARSNGVGPVLSAAALVSLLNKQLYANTSAEKYATFYFALYDEQSSMLTYTNAGHLPPILVHNGLPQMLDVTGTVVGAFPFTRYDERQVRLESGDVLVGYTDGITEPENEYGEMFGEERLKDLVVKHVHRDAAEIIARVMEAVEQWTGGGELQDDMTMLVARKL